VVYFFSNGVAQWQPAFFERSFGLKSGALGSWFAAVYGIGGFIGMSVGGEWASRYAANNERLQLRVMAVAYCAYGLLLTLVYVSPNQYCALLLLALAAVVGATTSGPLFATIQSLVPPHMRAVSIAIIYLFANLIGFGVGPLATGILSDMLGSLRTALLCMCPGFLWVAWHLWAASSSVTRDLQCAGAPTDTSKSGRAPTARTGGARPGWD
jgi:MFS family permease